MVHSTDSALKHFINNQKTFFDNAQCIEHAIALHEKGNRIDPGISFYKKLYADLVDRSAQVGKAIAQNEAKVDPEVLKAHRELDAKLSALSLRVAIASEAKLGLSKGAKMGCYALAAGIAAAAAYYLYQTWPTEETMKRVFDLGLGVKEEVLDTSRCTRTMALNGDITRTCVTKRSTVNSDSLNQWLAGTKTCIDVIPSSSHADHRWCAIPPWDPAEKTDLLHKGEEWIQNEEWVNCSANNPRPAQAECRTRPKDSPFGTLQAKRAFETYSKLLDQSCQEHACQRLDEPCGIDVGCFTRVSNPFAHEETQKELLAAIWKKTPYPQTLERVRAIAREKSLLDERLRYSEGGRDEFTFSFVKDGIFDRPKSQVRDDLEDCQMREHCDQLGWGRSYCVKTKCEKENRNYFEKFYALPTEWGKRFWDSCMSKIEAVCAPSGCEISDWQICEASETCHMKLLGVTDPEAIQRFVKSNCEKFW